MAVYVSHSRQQQGYILKEIKLIIVRKVSFFLH